MDAESEQLELQRQQLIQHTARRTFAPAELAAVRQHVDAACESLQTVIKSDAYLSETVVLPGSNPLDDHGAVTNLWQHPSWRAALDHELVQHAPGTVLQALLDSTEQQCAALQQATESIDLVADARALQLQIEGAEGDVAQKADPKRSLLDLVLVCFSNSFHIAVCIVRFILFVCFSGYETRALVTLHGHRTNAQSVGRVVAPSAGNLPRLAAPRGLRIRSSCHAA
jgi:hypothetical protein